uniref:Uncharacterized protein n=1 Tax=Panagrolaimus superbus TaxID=310955 RepID=A0A914Z0E0_9BILA
MSKVDFRREAPNFSKQICENLVIKAECHHFEPAIAQINEIFLEQISKELCQYLEHYCYSNPHFVCDYRQPQSLLTETRLKTYVLGNVNGTETLILIDKFCQKSYVTTTFLQKIDANEDFDKVMTQRIINPRILLQTVSGLNLTLNGETNEIELINIKTTNIITSFDILLGRDMIKLWTNKVKLLKIMFKLDQPLVKQDVNVALTKNFDNKFSDHTVTQTFETVNGHELTQPFSVDQYEPPSKIPEQENPLIGEP